MKKEILFLLAMLPMLFTSCSKDDDSNGGYYGDKRPIVINIGESKALNLAPNTYSKNPFIVSVNDKGIYGEHVGKTDIVTKGTPISVEVKGKYHTYPDPITNWGCNMSYIKNNYKSGVSWKEDDGTLVYENCGKSELVMYIFEYGKLYGVGAVVKSSYASEIGNYINERYFVLPYDLGEYTYGGSNAYSTDKASTFVYLKISDNAKYISAIYLESPQKSKTKSIELYDKRINDIESALKKYIE